MEKRNSKWIILVTTTVLISYLIIHKKNIFNLYSALMKILNLASETSDYSKNEKINNIITAELINEFISEGVIVVPKVLSKEEIESARAGLHKNLLSHGVDVLNLESTAGNLSLLSSTGGAGGILDLFYEDWKLKINEHPKVMKIFSELWRNTFSTCEGVYSHPFGKFNADIAYIYIDRVCFRVSDTISYKYRVNKKKSLQRSLTPHLDCCPHNMYESEKEHPKWRPIQGFIALTDTMEPNMGGFEASPRLHQRFETWALNRIPSNTGTPPPCVGEFSPIRPVEDKDVISNFRHIPCRAGDMVLWDYRTPHANSRRNDASTSREVVYISLLPGILRNKQYAEHQLLRFQKGLVPDDQWHEHASRQVCYYKFSELGRLLMTIDYW